MKRVPPHRVFVSLALTSLALVGAWAATRPGAGNPLLDPSVAPERGPVTGQVLSRLAAGSYAYLEVRDESGQVLWLVTLDGPAARAAWVQGTFLARADRFHSARLGRDFAPLHFAALTASR